MYRSTKGASKARRDQINSEIRNLKDLLPISEADKARLSYLHIMSLACMYTRKSIFFSQDVTAARQDASAIFMGLTDLPELVHTLPGFLLLLTSEGKLIYLSDNVSEHLGHPMVDLLAQSDSVYDIIDPADHFVMRNNLLSVTTPDTERLFRCRFNTSKFARRQGSGNKVTLVRARCLPTPFHASSYWSSNAVWVCFCSSLELSNLASTTNPLPTPPAEQIFQLTSFQSQHGRDMRIHAAQESVSVYLGYDVETLRSRSWYSLLHPRDLSHASAQHCTLLRESMERQVEMVVQVETADHSWVWLYMVLQLQTGEHPITCQSYVISESEAWSVRQQINSEHNQLTLLYQEGLAQQFSPLSSPDQVFTPSSSGLSAQSFDFSFTASGHSSSEELPSTSTQSNQPLEPCPNFAIDEDFSQLHGSQQMWLPEARRFSKDISPPSNMPNVCTVSQIPVSSPSHPCLGMSRPHSMELLCTPPYTPRIGGGCFMFGEEVFKSDSTSSISGLSQTIQANHLASLAAGVGLKQSCHRLLNDNLPPTPDSPVSDECVLMALPEISGPLYVDTYVRPVHHGPPECLLTPEASPTEHPCSGFFPQQAKHDKEKLEISLLAQYLSSITEGFLKDHPSLTHLSSPVSSLEPLSAQKSVPHLCEFSPTVCFEKACSSLGQDQLSLLQEELALPVMPMSCSSSSSSPPHSSIYHPPPPYQQEEALVGVQHLCSVQSTHSNNMLMESGVNSNQAPVESAMDEEILPLPALQEMTPAPAHNALSPGPPCTQFLLEELVDMDPMFEAATSISPALRQQPELYQLTFEDSPQHYQDGTGDHVLK
ncbi:neuronal PAS domain-containing protein 4B [Trichomycterus rosablanca]|uniref:neuronal PAS domain-containing protein 4B n=1 Tax=Trichomycterus rosablanca TaxID=2290929 RepID=UPI002F35513C